MKTTKIHKGLRSTEGGIAFGHDESGKKVKLRRNRYGTFPSLLVSGSVGKASTAAVIAHGAHRRGVIVNLVNAGDFNRSLVPVAAIANDVSDTFEAAADRLEELLLIAQTRLERGLANDDGSQILVVVNELDNLMAPAAAPCGAALAAGDPSAKVDVDNRNRGRAALAFVRLARIADRTGITLVGLSREHPEAFLGWADGTDIVERCGVLIVGPGHRDEILGALCERSTPEENNLDLVESALNAHYPGERIMAVGEGLFHAAEGEPVVFTKLWYLPRSWSRGGAR